MIKKIKCFFINIIGYRIINKGKNNKLIKQSKTLFNNTKIIIEGNSNRIVFGKNCKISGLQILILGDNNLIEIGDNVTINASKIQPTTINAVGGKTIKIGSGSLISNNVEIHTSDYHGIYDEDGNRINMDKDIIIGEKVWICLGTKILKGTNIENGCIIGAGSVISGIHKIPNSIICGNPAKIIKKNIFWAKKRVDKISINN